MCKHAYYVETKADKHDEPLQACEPSMHTCHSVGGRTTENTSCKPQGVHLARAYQSEPYWYQLRQGDGRRTRSKCLNKQSKAENSNFAIGVRASGRKWYQLMRTHTSYKESTQTVHTLWILKGYAGVVPGLDGETRVVSWRHTNNQPNDFLGYTWAHYFPYLVYPWYQVKVGCQAVWSQQRLFISANSIQTLNLLYLSMSHDPTFHQCYALQTNGRHSCPSIGKRP